jgi:hypothetical protein
MKKKESLVGTNKWVVKNNAHQKDSIKKVINLERKAMFKQEDADVCEAFDRKLESIRDTGLNIEMHGYKPCYPVSYEDLHLPIGFLTVRYHLSDEIDVFSITSELAEEAMAMRKPDVPIWIGIIVIDEVAMIFNLITHNEHMEELLTLAQEEGAELTSQSRE